MSRSSDEELFSDRARADSSPATHLESPYEFLDRVSGAYWQQIRDEVENWLARVPSAERRDLAGRLRNKNAGEFASAYLELYLHETFVRHGFAVECHPDTGRSRRVDFRVERGDEVMYVEARQVGRASSHEYGEARRVDAVYEALNQVESPNFFLWVDVREVGPNELRKKRLVRQVEQWLASLNPDEQQRMLERNGFDGVEGLAWKERGWHLLLRAIPVGAAHRGSPDMRPVGVTGGTDVHAVDPPGMIRAALEDKGSAYGDLDAPFVIALGISGFVDRTGDDMAAALHGSERITQRRRAQPELVRAPDGYWFRGNRWANPGVSGVLSVTNLHPATFLDADPTLWLHPEPDHRARPLPSWRHVALSKDALEVFDPTMTQAEVFDLPADWPRGEPFPES